MTEREALRLLHLEDGCSQDELRRAYLDMVKVWHPDRFQADVHLRAKAERTLQGINDAYALLQGRTTNPASASATDSGKEPEAATARPEYRAPADAAPPPKATAPSPKAERLSGRLVLAGAVGAAVGVALGLLAIVKWSEELTPAQASDAARYAQRAPGRSPAARHSSPSAPSWSARAIHAANQLCRSPSVMPATVASTRPTSPTPQAA